MARWQKVANQIAWVKSSSITGLGKLARRQKSIYINIYYAIVHSIYQLREELNVF
ncbi:hypothetical protein OZD61_00145 [Wolbachia endosymbiont of Drosophila bocki]|uniref:hypothetical protein n=1 Tax=Wolbachia endosymbiont of Drosophila bocki TaxID=3002576 RepID=UPI0023A92183|nr:hypothetical protein [Wolbachia endosymbiont of Drosophila bocki]MDE5057225.1 hypothetical protein [Wolbachia endosymbiont of Drosophila bocki]